MDKKIIYKELIKLGGGVDLKGFEYLVSGIEKCFYEPLVKTIYLYTVIGKEFNDTPSRVERAIRHYIEKCMLKGNKEEINKLNMKYNEKGIPTNTEFLRAFAIYLKLNY